MKTWALCGKIGKIPSQSAPLTLILTSLTPRLSLMTYIPLVDLDMDKRSRHVTRRPSSPSTVRTYERFSKAERLYLLVGK